MTTRRYVLRVLGALALALTVGDPSVAAPTQGKKASTTVYVTRTGTKYHVGTCRHLARSKIAMSLAEAAKRYDPCGTCRPPRP